MNSNYHRLFINPIITATIVVSAWIALVVIEMRGVTDIDDAVALWLNKAIGDSELLDLTVLFFSKPAGDLFLAVLAGILVIRLLRNPKRAWPLTALATAIYYAIVLLAAYLFIDVIDGYLRRESPAAHLEGFIQVGATFGIETRIDDHSRFPSERATYFTIVMLLTWFRFGSRARILIVLLLLTTLAQLAAGMIWFSDVIGGILCGWLIAVFVYTIRFNVLALILEEKLVRFWKNYFQSSFLRIYRRIEGETVSPFHRFEKRYAKGGRENSRKLAPIDSQIATVLETEWGLKDVILLAKPHKSKLFPIKCGDTRYAFKISRLELDRLKNLEMALRITHELAADNILQFPAVIPRKNGDVIYHSDPKLVYLMEWKEGRPLDTANLSEVMLLMRTLARFHQVTAQRYSQGSDTVDEVISKDVEEIMRGTSLLAERSQGRASFFRPPNAESREMTTLLSDGVRAQQVARLALTIAGNDRETSKCFIHLDTHPMNYLIAADNQLVMLDFDTIIEGSRHQDLIMPLRKTLRRQNWEPTAFIALIDAYQEEQPLHRWEIQLIIAALLVPDSVVKVGRKTRRTKLFSRQKRFELLKESLQHNFERNARIALALEAVEHYNLAPVDALYSD